MIKSVKECIAVQTRRVQAGKFGYSKAVRTFLRNHSDDWSEYEENLKLLPVQWPEKKGKKRKNEDGDVSATLGIQIEDAVSQDQEKE